MYISAGFGLRPLLYFTFCCLFLFLFSVLLSIRSFCFFFPLAEPFPFILYSIERRKPLDYDLCIVDDLWMDMLIFDTPNYCKPRTQVSFAGEGRISLSSAIPCIARVW